MHAFTGLRRATLPLAVLLASAACEEAPTAELPPPIVTLTAPSTRTVVAGTSLQLTPDVTEVDGSVSTRRLQWQSSDPAIATVDGAGRVSAVESGTVVITASVGGASDTLALTAMRPPNPGGPQSTFLAFTSTRDDFIGQGQSPRYTLNTGTWSATLFGQRRGARVTYNSSQLNGWTLELFAPNGAPLKVGTYEGATRYPFQAPTVPGLSFTGNGRGCNTLTGRFVVHDVAYTHEGQLQRLHATFRQHCEGGPSYLEGEVAILQNPLR